MKIVEMSPGVGVEDFYLLRSAKVQTSRNGSAYLSCVFADKDAEIEGRIWDYAADIHEHVGSVVKIRGTVSEYNGSNQIVVSRIRLAQPGEYDLAALVPSAPMPLDALMEDVVSMVSTIEDNVYRAIAMEVLNRMSVSGMAKTLPAAKAVHHAFVGGWLMHTHDIMTMCDAACALYGPLVNRDLLLTGALCHDMGKRKEFALADTGLVADYSIQGALIGHLVMGAQEIAEIAKELGLDNSTQHVMLLQHMLLSHHGQPEFGAAVVPKVLEAEILAHLDDLDAKVEIYRENLQNATPGAMTDKVWALGHSVYAPIETPAISN